MDYILRLDSDELEILQKAILVRISELETRKRLPRGCSVKQVRNEIGTLEDLAEQLGRLRVSYPQLEFAGGRGVEIGDRVPVGDLTAADA